MSRGGFFLFFFLFLYTSPTSSGTSLIIWENRFLAQETMAYLGLFILLDSPQQKRFSFLCPILRAGLFFIMHYIIEISRRAQFDTGSSLHIVEWSSLQANLL